MYTIKSNNIIQDLFPMKRFTSLVMYLFGWKGATMCSPALVFSFLDNRNEPTARLLIFTLHCSEVSDGEKSTIKSTESGVTALISWVDWIFEAMSFLSSAMIIFFLIVFWMQVHLFLSEFFHWNIEINQIVVWNLVVNVMDWWEWHICLCNQSINYISTSKACWSVDVLMEFLMFLILRHSFHPLLRGMLFKMLVEIVWVTLLLLRDWVVMKSLNTRNLDVFISFFSVRWWSVCIHW